MNTATKVETSEYGEKIIDTKNKEVNLLQQLVKE